MAERCSRILSDDRQCSNPKAPGREYCALHNPMVAPEKGAMSEEARSAYEAWATTADPPWDGLPIGVQALWDTAVASVSNFKRDEEFFARALALRSKLLREIESGPSAYGFSDKAIDIIVEALKHEHDLANDGED